VKIAFDAGDFVWLTFDPQAGRRPALVLTPKTYNAKSGLALACPVTNQIKGYPFEVAVPAARERLASFWLITLRVLTGKHVAPNCWDSARMK